MHRGLTPPDVDNLPPLPERFSWQLPHVKQHRRPTPEARQIVLDGAGPAVASVQPSIGKASTIVGIHRWLESGRHYREFTSHEVALRYVAAWAWRYADLIAEEVEDHRRVNAGR
ncbi:hypothetical protein AB4Y64_09890 [Lysobacter sp. TAF61]|uniref:hypothetical protein n=1 Tax=Lysobacter sp. TAF61 TaxID=3233072 RepID=UPI003F9976DC